MPEERKLVSVLFADIVGSTALGHDNDPEVVRAVLGRYFDRVREIVERHGGSVEKYIGDAVMAVFGVPRVHDDDAERAVRAALAIRDSMAPLNSELALQLEARIGIDSGEAVAALDERDQRLVTGDVVNVAARLQQHADPGEIVVGALTEQLSREAISYEPIEPLSVRGKPEPITAFRAVRARSELPEQARGLPQMRARLVGRTRELTLLADTFERATTDRRGQLFTIVGSAGVGKSRLVGEFLARVGGATDVRVLRGRCLPYGTGITYWPFVEWLQADLGVTGEQHRAAVLERLKGRLDELVPEPLRIAVLARLTVLIGLADAVDELPDVASARLPAELGWAIGEYLRAASEQSPTIGVIDDLQWAEEPAIAIVRELVDSTADSPFLLLCIARPELLEHRPDWGGGLANATTIVLEPLSDQETRTLIGRLLDVDDMPDELRARIVARSGGNPLFCEEFVRMLIDEGRIVRDGDRWRGAQADSFEVPVPESIHALLSARLDGLPPLQKAVVQAASVMGEQFDADGLAQLVSADSLPDLQPLVRAGFVLPDRPAGPRAYRFKHLLIRDVAYASLPKSERARLHEAFGLAVEAAAGDRREAYIEILAYHAERTVALTMELRLTGGVLEHRAQRALDLNIEAGRRAYERGNLDALTKFITTARFAQQAVTADVSAKLAEIELLDAEAEGIRGNYLVARQRLARAADLAASAGRMDLQADADFALTDVLLYSAGEEDQPLLDRAVESARRAYAAIGNRRGYLLAELAGLEWLYQTGHMRPMVERGLALADEALAESERAVAARALARLIGPAIWTAQLTLAAELADRADALSAELGLLATARVSRFFQARLHWVRAEFEAAEASLRGLLRDARAAGDGQLIIASNRLLAETMLSTDRLAEALPILDEVIDDSRRFGERWSRTELLAFKAYAKTRLGDLDEAEQLLAESNETLRSTDYAAVTTYDYGLSVLRSAQGRYDEAEAALRHGLEAVLGTDNWSWLSSTLDLAEFLVDRGRVAEAAPLLEKVAKAMEGSGLTIVRLQLDRLRARLTAQPMRANT